MRLPKQIRRVKVGDMVNAGSSSPTIGPSDEVDEGARLLFENWLPLRWKKRKQVPDIHVDYRVEIIQDGEPTGLHFQAQIKGRSIHKRKAKKLSEPFKAKHLRYYLRCEEPVFLFLIDPASKQGNWLFVQRYLKEQLRDFGTLKSQKTFTIHFDAGQSFENLEGFQVALREAWSYMRDLNPGSIPAAVRAKQEKLEAKDNRIRVKVNFVDGVENVAILPKEEILLELKLKTPAAQESIRDHLEKGADVRLKSGEFELLGSPFFEDANAPGAELAIKSGSPRDGQALLSWDGIGATPPLILSGCYRAGSKYMSFDSNLSKSPLNLSLSFGANTVNKAAPFDCSLTFRPSAWMGQQLQALPHFDAIDAFCRASVNGQTLRLEFLIQGNRLGAATTQKEKLRSFLAKLSFVDFVRKARQVFRHFNLNPILPLAREITESDFTDTEELFAMLYQKQHRCRTPRAPLKFTTSKQPTEADLQHPPQATCIHAPTITYTIFKTPLVIGPVSIKYTEMAFESVAPVKSGVRICFRGTENCERIMQLDNL